MANEGVDLSDEEAGFDEAFGKELERRGETADQVNLDDGEVDADDAGGASDAGSGSGAAAVAQPPAADTGDPWKDAPPQLRQMYSDMQAKAAALEHSARSQAGRVSALQKKIDDLQASTRSSKPGASGDGGPAAVGDGGDLDEEAFERDFPQVAGFVRKTVKQEVEPVRETVQQREEREAAAREESRIAAAFSAVAQAHPDFDHIRQDPAYANWLLGQAPGIQQLAYSENPQDAIELIGLYKSRVKPAAGGNRTRVVDAAVETPSKGAPRRSGLSNDDFDSNFEAHADRISKRNQQR